MQQKVATLVASEFFDQGDLELEQLHQKPIVSIFAVSVKNHFPPNNFSCVLDISFWVKTMLNMVNFMVYCYKNIGFGDTTFGFSSKQNFCVDFHCS